MNNRRFWYLFIVSIILYYSAISIGCIPYEPQSLTDDVFPQLPIEKESCPDGLCLIEGDYVNRISSKVPEHYRYDNYARGSCVHASLATIMMYFEQPETADIWTDTFRGGEYSSRLHDRLDMLQIEWDATWSGFDSFLDRMMEKNQPCIVTFKPKHMCLLIGLDPIYLWDGDQWLVNPAPKAHIIDPNNTKEIEIYTRDNFLQGWHNGGGWATTIFFE